MRDSHNYQLAGKIGTLKHDVIFHSWSPITRETTTYTVPKGTKVKIVMQSRFGDVGITTNLNTTFGYQARVDAIDTLDFNEEP